MAGLPPCQRRLLHAMMRLRLFVRRVDHLDGGCGSSVVER
jgi:hypothetical protein